jgi:xanthine dehydrogenase accessory factor
MVTLQMLSDLESKGLRGVIITVVDARGSTPRKAGARMVVMEDCSTQGSVGGGAVEHKAMAACAEVLQSGMPRLMEVHLGQELGMCCGGTMRLYLEPLTAAVPFVFLGAGHVARACAHLFHTLGFSLHVADGREGFATRGHFPLAATLVDGLEPTDLNALPMGPRAFVLIATHDHALDQRLVEMCLRRPLAWLGLIGSRRKALRTRERCLHRGFLPKEIGRLRCPVGLDVGAQTPEEIAVSVAAEVLALQRRGEFHSVSRMAVDLSSAQPTDVEPAFRDALPLLQQRRSG